MKYISKNVLGVFVVENGQATDWELFPHDPDRILDKIDGRCQEEQQLADKHGITENKQHSALPLGQQADAIQTADELYQLQHQVAQKYTRKKIQQSHDRDRLLVQATRTLKDLDKVSNALIERLRAWYRIYYPEMEDQIDQHQEFAQQVAEHFDREEIDSIEQPETTTGMELEQTDKEAIQKLAQQIQHTYQLREDTKIYIQSLAERLAPNLSAVLGKLLAAQLISEAGSLEKLSKMPSSTIQVIGAEKALFRHMRGEGTAPKHGILFMHTKVKTLPDNKRGKMARYIANKSSIASRLDHFNGDFKGNELRQEIQEKYEKVKEE